MLVSNKIKEMIKKEIKAQENYLKILVQQEKNYNVNLSDEIEETKASIEYYNKVLEEK